MKKQIYKRWIVVLVCVVGFFLILGVQTKDYNKKLKNEAEEFIIIEKDVSEIKDNTIEDLNELNKNRSEELELETKNGKIVSISGLFSDINVNSPETALMAICNVRGILDIANPLNELKYIQSNKDEYGTQYNFQQVYKGIEVYGRTMTICVDNMGLATSLSSGYLSLYPNEFSKDGIKTEKDIKRISLEGIEKVRKNEIVSMGIYSLEEYEETPLLSYKVLISGVNKEGKEIDDTLIIDTESGNILIRYSTIMD